MRRGDRVCQQTMATGPSLQDSSERTRRPRIPPARWPLAGCILGWPWEWRPFRARGNRSGAGSACEDPVPLFAGRRTALAEKAPHRPTRLLPRALKGRPVPDVAQGTGVERKRDDKPWVAAFSEVLLLKGRLSKPDSCTPPAGVRALPPHFRPEGCQRLTSQRTGWTSLQSESRRRRDRRPSMA